MKKIDKFTVYGSLLFILIGIVLICSGLFFYEHFDAWYAVHHSVGIAESVNSIVRNVGFRPISVAAGLFSIGASVCAIYSGIKSTKPEV